MMGFLFGARRGLGGSPIESEGLRVGNQINR
jgi:hypothetical protein